MMTTLRERIARISLSCLAGALGACSPSGGSGGTAPAQLEPLDLLVGSSGAPELFSFELTLAEVRPVAAGGAVGENLLPGPIEVEWVSLDGTAGWLARAELEAGSYTGLELLIQPGSERATARDGAHVQVLPTSQRLELVLDEPYRPGPGACALEVALDLGASLEGDLSQGVLAFTPLGEVLPGSGTRTVNELYGRVEEVAPDQQALEVQAYRDAELEERLGKLEVVLGDPVLLLGPAHEALESADFFARIEPGETVLAIRGERRDDGSLVAERLALEPDGGQGTMPVRIEGMVASIESESLFLLLVREIEAGEELAESVLADQADGSTIAVLVGEETLFRREGQQVGAEALVVGQAVRVEFAEFLAPPFPAALVELEEEGACYQGTIASVADLPAAFGLRLGNDEPSVEAGEVPPDSDLRVELGESEIRLALHGAAELGSEHLVRGMRARACGTLSEEDGQLRLVAREVVVHPGHLVHGLVVGFAAAAGTISLEGARIVQTFGDQALDGALLVRVHPEALIKQDAATLEELFAALAAMRPEQSAELQVKGVGSSEPGVIVAFELRLHLR
jgi:hypothetical protein